MSIDLEALRRFTEQVQKLQAIAPDVMPMIETVRDLDGAAIIPTDRLIRTSEAADILGVNKSNHLSPSSKYQRKWALTRIRLHSSKSWL
ncbi:MAG: hypothetical protein IKD73_02765 [Selenomonadaceae bacterium]|nr:hypothetical protein [Selenomonadaceae bacterium]